MQQFDVVIVGAGAAGLMCAATAGYRDRRVLVIDHANKAGKKILMSGGGRCNFTHLNSTPANFVSQNPAFCISALKRYTPHHFLELVERHGIDWCEKTPGQLFCEHSSKDIVAMLLTECEWAGANVALNTSIKLIEQVGGSFRLATTIGDIQCESLVIASGGLSIPTMGASAFGYQVAEQFSLAVLPCRAALVPLTLQPVDKQYLEPLSGVSLDVEVSLGKHRYREPMLVTHRGVSGPSILQISSFWHPGDSVSIDLLPDISNVFEALCTFRKAKPAATLARFLSEHLSKRFAETFCQWQDWAVPVQHYSHVELEEVAQLIKSWQLKPSGTEGYRTAEVTRGGVDTDELSSQSMMAKNVQGLYFIGEVVDVTGELGGHNFQWAWASGWCAGQFV